VTQAVLHSFEPSPRIFCSTFFRSSNNIDTTNAALKCHVKKGINMLYHWLFSDLVTNDPSTTDPFLPPTVLSQRKSTKVPTPSTAFLNCPASPAGDGHGQSALSHRRYTLLNQFQTSWRIHNVAERYDIEAHRFNIAFVVTAAVAALTCWAIMRARYTSASCPHLPVDDEGISCQNSLSKQHAEVTSSVSPSGMAGKGRVTHHDLWIEDWNIRITRLTFYTSFYSRSPQ